MEELIVITDFQVSWAYQYCYTSHGRVVKILIFSRNCNLSWGLSKLEFLLQWTAAGFVVILVLCV
jgi:hypothetical protein